MRRRTASWTAAGVLALLIAIAVSLPRWKDRQSDTAPVEPPAEAPEALPAERGLTWTDGARQRYELRVTTEIASPGAGGLDTQRRTVDALLDLRVLDVGDRVEVAFALEPADASSNADGLPSPRDRARPFVIVFSPEGEVLETRFDPRTSPLGRQQLAECIRAFEVIVPADGRRDWTAEQSHDRGRYTAVYRRESADEVLKRKLSYGSSRAPGDPSAGLRVERSLTRARLSAGVTWLEAATIEETLVQALAPGLEIRSRLRARLTRRDDIGPAGLAIDGPAEELRVVARETTATTAEPPDRVEAPRQPRGPSARDVAMLGELLERFDSSAGRERSAILALRRLLREHPELALLVRELVDDPTLRRASVAELFHLLEVVGTEEAQGVLRELALDGGQRHDNRLRAIIALGGLLEPSDASLDSLWRVAESRRTPIEVDASNTAGLALGRAGSQLRTQDPGRYASIRERLVGRLRSAPDDGARCNALSSVGNTYDGDLAAEATPYLTHESALVRHAAAAALGTLPSPDTAGELLRRLPRESDGGVRAALVESLRRLEAHDATTASAVHALARSESDADARLEMVRLLVESGRADGEARADLERMMATDGSRRVRGYLARALYGVAAPTGR